jgi:hypothetical protein
MATDEDLWQELAAETRNAMEVGDWWLAALDRAIVAVLGAKLYAEAGQGTLAARVAAAGLRGTEEALALALAAARTGNVVPFPGGR